MIGSQDQSDLLAETRNANNLSLQEIPNELNELLEMNINHFDKMVELDFDLSSEF